MAGFCGTAGLSLCPGRCYSFYVGTSVDNGRTGVNLLLHPFGVEYRDTIGGFVDGRFFGVSGAGFVIQDFSGFLALGVAGEMGLFMGYRAFNQQDDSSYHKVSSSFVVRAEPSIKPFIRVPSGREGWAVEMWTGYGWPSDKQLGAGLLLGLPEFKDY